jgi:ADP-heptose:LPS heptosyltransferase
MDVVISVDTSVAHLSGAIGKKTWLLIPFSPDWRWMLDRKDTPWYQSMTIYRQESMKNWAPVFAKVAIDLKKELKDIQIDYE